MGKKIDIMGKVILGDEKTKGKIFDNKWIFEYANLQFESDEKIKDKLKNLELIINDLKSSEIDVGIILGFKSNQK